MSDSETIRHLQNEIDDQASELYILRKEFDAAVQAHCQEKMNQTRDINRNPADVFFEELDQKNVSRSNITIRIQALQDETKKLRCENKQLREAALAQKSTFDKEAQAKQDELEKKISTLEEQLELRKQLLVRVAEQRDQCQDRNVELGKNCETLEERIIVLCKASRDFSNQADEEIQRLKLENSTLEDRVNAICVQKNELNEKLSKLEQKINDSDADRKVVYKLSIFRQEFESNDLYFGSKNALEEYSAKFEEAEKFVRHPSDMASRMWTKIKEISLEAE